MSPPVVESPAPCVKGTGLSSSLRWARQRYDAVTYQRVLASLNEELREVVGTAFGPSWYPIEAIDSLWQAILEVAHHGDRAGFEIAMAENGRYVAADHLKSVYRVFLALLASPDRIFDALPRLWGMYFSGISVQVQSSQEGEGRGVCRVERLGSLRHVAPVASGWITYALEAVGGRDVEVVERNYSNGMPSAAELHFDISWRS
ncbi:MAG: hypothetical protein AAGD01_16830 [Acidobacteriota bacterium]